MSTVVFIVWLVVCSCLTHGEHVVWCCMHVCLHWCQSHCIPSQFWACFLQTFSKFHPHSFYHIFPHFLSSHNFFPSGSRSNHHSNKNATSARKFLAYWRLFHFKFIQSSLTLWSCVCVLAWDYTIIWQYRLALLKSLLAHISPLTIIHSGEVFTYFYSIILSLFLFLHCQLITLSTSNASQLFVVPGFCFSSVSSLHLSFILFIHPAALLSLYVYVLHQYFAFFGWVKNKKYFTDFFLITLDFSNGDFVCVTSFFLFLSSSHSYPPPVTPVGKPRGPSLCFCGCRAKCQHWGDGVLQLH